MKIIECPRDAWQGFHPFLSTEQKAAYLNKLLQVGFDTIDFGSFVSPRAMPQVADTAEVLSLLDLSYTNTKLLAIVANQRGIEKAAEHNKITCLGFPFSISETFQLRNTNASISASFETVEHLAMTCEQSGQTPVVYISMGFGNPYGDLWNAAYVLEWVEKLADLGVKIFSLSDTVGVATPGDIAYIFENLISNRPDLEFGAHFHTTPDSWYEKLQAAYGAGCRRFDGALLGYGGCPMAQNELVGNMPTEHLVSFAAEMGETLLIKEDLLGEAARLFARLVNG